MTTTAPEANEATRELWTPPGAVKPPVPGVPESSGELPPPEPPNWALGVDEPARPPRQRRRSRKPMPFEARLLIQVLLILSVGTLGFAGYLLVFSPIEKNNDQDRLYATFREQLAQATAPTGGLIEPGSPMALLSIPGLNLNQVVVEGTSSGDLEHGPGHLRNTPLPGQVGWSFILGKSSTFGGPFGQIDRLHAGDHITVRTGQGTFDYRVTGVRRPGDSVPATLANGAGRLTLETAQHQNLLQHQNILLVDADLLDKPRPLPSDLPRLIPPEEYAMVSDAATGFLALVLWLQALCLVLAGTVWARHRWGKRETLVVGIPVVLAIVWNLYESAGRLLPNLL